MGYYYGPSHMGMGILGGFLSIVFWVLIVWLIIAVIRRLSGGRGSWMMHHHDWDHMGSHRAVSILKERYAKGELSKEEFESKKKDIEA